MSPPSPMAGKTQSPEAEENHSKSHSEARTAPTCMSKDKTAYSCPNTACLQKPNGNMQQWDWSVSETTTCTAEEKNIHGKASTAVPEKEESVATSWQTSNKVTETTVELQDGATPEPT